ncbi:hypothetical protein FRB99_001399 [Tulasnella sp. 403]|nr:hypothetical protein FRB99_001399 [Tulasnella sp. 403]
MATNSPPTPTANNPQPENNPFAYTQAYGSYQPTFDHEARRWSLCDQPSSANNMYHRPWTTQSSAFQSNSYCVSSSRPSTSSSLVSTSSLSSYSSSQHVATPHTGSSESLLTPNHAFYPPSSVSSASSNNRLKHRDSFYALTPAGRAAPNESTDTIVDLVNGRNGTFGGLGLTDPPAIYTNGEYNNNNAPAQSSAEDPEADSNPFFFGRELQSLQVQERQTQQQLQQSLPPLSDSTAQRRPASSHVLGSLPPTSPGYAVRSASIHSLQSNRPLTGRTHSSHGTLHPTLQTAIANTSPSDQYRFYGPQSAGLTPSSASYTPGYNGYDDYGTPPSTAGSSFFDMAISLPQPPRTSAGIVSVGGTTSGAFPPSAHNYLAQGRRDSMPALSSHNSYPALGPLSSNQTSNTSPSSSTNQQPSPYSLIIENPDPATRGSRPHLCTHCNETFRRIHDAKRHAFGALGIKNYACMGGCGMTFKRSEGRARHWMREEVAGVGNSISVADFFTLNPAMVGTAVGSGSIGLIGPHVPPGQMMIWGGKGCEERHGRIMSGTMEEDRRLRNKARRERILMIGARAAALAAVNSKKDRDGDAGDDQRPLSAGGPSPPSAGEDLGPVRHVRTSHAVRPY